MHYVYLLKSERTGDFYVGCTNNLEKRISEHNASKSYYVKVHSPWKLIYFEGFIAKDDAFAREQSLKLHAQGLRRLKERLRASLAA